MESTYIARYERNLIENATNDAKKSIALKLKAAGVSSDIIFECTGFRL